MPIKMAFQLSSVAPYLDTPEHLRQTFYKLAGIGYRYVQLQGASVDIENTILAKALIEAGLSCVATQEDYPFGFGANPERAIERAVCCGAKYLCCACIPREVTTKDELKKFSENLNAIIEKVKTAGLVFTFHPITPDFRKMDGVPVYARLMEMLPKDVQLTFCVNAAFGAGIYDPMPIFKKYAGRMDLVHFKDDAPMPDGSSHLMPLGQGIHDWRPVLSACKQARVKYIFAEQERWLKNAFDCAQDSYNYLVSLGL